MKVMLVELGALAHPRVRRAAMTAAAYTGNQVVVLSGTGPDETRAQLARTIGTGVGVRYCPGPAGLDPATARAALVEAITRAIGPFDLSAYARQLDVLDAWSVVLHGRLQPASWTLYSVDGDVRPHASTAVHARTTS